MNVNSLVALVKNIQGTNTWDITSIIRIGGILAVEVNKFTNLSGEGKSTLIVNVIHKVLDEVENNEINETGRTEEDKVILKKRYTDLKLSVSTVLPASLELAVSAARGRVNLKKLKEPSFWAKLCSCLATSVVTVLASQDVISESQAKTISGVVQGVEGFAEAVLTEKVVEKAVIQTEFQENKKNQSEVASL